MFINQATRIRVSKTHRALIKPGNTLKDVYRKNIFTNTFYRMLDTGFNSIKELRFILYSRLSI